MIRNVLLYFFIALLLSSQMGCRSSDSEINTTTVVDKAYWLIENGEIDRAVTTLNQALMEDPYNNEIRIALASTYAQLAGLEVSRFFNIAETFIGEIKDENSSVRFYALEEHLIRDLGPQGEVLAKQLAALAAVDRALFQIDLIPSVEKVESYYAKQALEVMYGISDPSPGQALFRGVLGAVDFKHQWDEKVFWDASLLCHVNTYSVSRGLSRLEAVLLRVMDDLAIGLPKEKDQILKGQKSLKKAVSQSQKLLGNESAASAYYAELLMGHLKEDCN